MGFSGSPVPFGGEPSADGEMICIPVSEIQVANAFRRGALGGLDWPADTDEGREMSPMPFGGEPSAD